MGDVSEKGADDLIFLINLREKKNYKKKGNNFFKSNVMIIIIIIIIIVIIITIDNDSLDPLEIQEGICLFIQLRIIIYI